MLVFFSEFCRRKYVFSEIHGVGFWWGVISHGCGVLLGILVHWSLWGWLESNLLLFPWVVMGFLGGFLLFLMVFYWVWLSSLFNIRRTRSLFYLIFHLIFTHTSFHFLPFLLRNIPRLNFHFVSHPSSSWLNYNIFFDLFGFHPNWSKNIL